MPGDPAISLKLSRLAAPGLLLFALLASDTLIHYRLRIGRRSAA